MPPDRFASEPGFVVRHRRVLLFVAAVATLAVVGLVLDRTSHDTTPGPEDVAPASDVAAAMKSSEKASTTKPAKHRPRDSRGVRAQNSDGKTYWCRPGALGEVDAANDRAVRREKVLKERRAAVRALEKQYPDGTAPGAVVDRYDRLVAEVNAQVKYTNRAIEHYNDLLRQNCDT